MKKKAIKEPSGSVKSDPLVLKEVSEYCKEHGIKIRYFVTEALKDRLKKEKEK